MSAHTAKGWWWLRVLALRHRRRILLAILLDAPVVVLGAWLLDTEINSGIPSLASVVMNWPLITCLTFFINRWILFSDRTIDFWSASKRYLALSVGHTAISLSFLAIMIEVLEWPAVEVSVCLTFVLACGSYIFRCVYAFANRPNQQVVATA